MVCGDEKNIWTKFLEREIEPSASSVSEKYKIAEAQEKPEVWQ